MGKEIERKFLLTEGASIPIPGKFTEFNIKQGYIAVEKDRQVRIRLTRDKAVIGIKLGDGIIRDEYEFEIPMSDGKEMYEKCVFKLEKKRLTFKRGNEQYDVDTLPNRLKFVEVEFTSIDNMEKWVKPHWIGEEITGIKKYTNIKLAKQNLKF